TGLSVEESFASVSYVQLLISFNFVFSPLAGGSTPPGITAPTVPSIPSPIGVNGFTGLLPQANGQPTAEAVFANGIHPYPAQSPTAADPLQQAYAGVQQYAGR
uniref:Uncharacterized protein n=1 Tax=Anser cygnoides TaxID=8845 RepID=A0A8B9IPG4_ANSCY